MKFTLSLILIIFCSFICQAQKADEKTVAAGQQKILKKQNIVDEFDNRAKDISLAAVRVFVRTRLAEWLWTNRKDETGRAEQIAIKAVDELYAKPDEMPDSRSLKSGLFRLLAVNAKETAGKLQTKYHIGDAEDFYISAPNLNSKGSDKILAEKIKNALTEANDLAAIQAYLMILQRQKSPEFVPLLSEILNIEESGRNNFTPASILWIANNFTDSTVPIGLKIRFYKFILNRAKNALLTSGGGEIHFADSALFIILPDIIANAPDLAAEASAIKSALSAKTLPGDRDFQESQKRIAESANKLDAMIAEADKTDNKNRSLSLLSEASRLASKEEKFKLAVDLIEKTIENKSEKPSSYFELLTSAHDQQLGFIVQNSLIKTDFDAAEYAAKRITDDLKKADALRQISIYSYKQKDVGSALNNYDEALKLTLLAENGDSKIRSLLGSVSNAAIIDQSRLSEIVSITSDAINNLPPLNPEDKPGSANFKKYVSTVLQTDFFLYISVSNLTLKNRNEAAYFAGQINRKEISIIADLALAIQTFESKKEQATK